MNEEPLEIRLLEETDILFAMSLKQSVRWNQTQRDWKRLIELEPQGCFAACLGGQMVGTTTTTSYGSELAWIGMVLVDPSHRRRGIATRLVKAALEYLREAAVSSVKLDATPDGQHVYQALDFEGELLIERWEGIARGAAAPACSTLDEQDLPGVMELDRRAFGADRSRLLRSLISEPDSAPLTCHDERGRLSGYALARRGTAATYIGPLIATDEHTAASLLDGMLNRLAGEKVYVDFHTGFETRTNLLARRGLAKQRDFVRMRYGKTCSAGTSPLVFAIAGPEVG